MPKAKTMLKESAIMAKVQKIRLGVVFGGKSGEHEVSLTSAASVMSALSPEKYEIIPIGITKEGKLASPVELKGMLPQPLFDRLVVRQKLIDGWKIEDTLSLSERTGPSTGAPQIIFPLLHGPFGEDGTFQGFLEIAGLPYIGCGVLASSVAMDKDVTKRLLQQAGLPVTPSITVLSRNIENNMENIELSASEAFGYPMFSKPANLGSSVGVRKIRNSNEFAEAVRHSAQYDRKVLIEKGIDAREIECAILGNDEPEASIVGEVISAGEFYDYEAKYENQESRLDIPANIDAHKAEEIRTMAIKAFKLIEGSGLARVDFFMDRNSEKVWINEINTMPGFTPISMYAKLWAASGVPFNALVQRLIQLGEERYFEKNSQKISGR
jgi:D-alanine-D-alanine ligase